MSFLIDYAVSSPKEELRKALEPVYTENWGDIGSLKGRLVCVLKAGTHAAAILLKPLYYLFSASIIIAAMRITAWIPEDRIDQIFRQPDLADMRHLRYPAYRELLEAEAKGILCSAPFAVLSQLILTGKAALGILHPGAYFANDVLRPHFRRLAAIGRQVGCPNDLLEKLERGSEIVSSNLRESPCSAYYYAQFSRDLSVIAEKMENPALSQTHKLSLLSMLSSEPGGASGIEACSPGLGRTLQQIRTHLALPESPEEVIPWLIGQFKGETLNQMIFQADASRLQDNRPDWHRLIDQLAHDSVHRGNRLILEIGNAIGLPQEMIARAENDPWFSSTRPLADPMKQTLIEAFRALISPPADPHLLIQVLLGKINSQEDGSLGLRDFRMHMTQVLAEDYETAHPEQEEIDPAIAVIGLYHISQGQGGDPSAPNFTDFNEAGIQKYCSLKGIALAV